MIKTVEVIGMIYKSSRYLDFMLDQLKRYTKDCKYDVQLSVIINDATTSLHKYIDEIKCYSPDVRFIYYNDKDPSDYYLNRVYRAWNAGGMCSMSDAIVFVNSDMAYTDGWLDSLVDNLDRNTIPCSLLVESGKMSSGINAISKNFGRNTVDYDENEFKSFANGLVETHGGKTLERGLYMPCAFFADEFKRSGGYPEGNIYSDGVGKNLSNFIRSGDDHFFHENEVMKKKQHITIIDSIVYHFQEGELDE